MRTLIAIVSAAAVLVAVLGRRHAEPEQSAQSSRIVVAGRFGRSRGRACAMSDPQASIGKLTSADTSVTAPVVVNGKGMGYLLASKLPKLPKQRTYQLWGQVGGRSCRSASSTAEPMSSSSRSGRDQRAALSRLMVTEENAPGVAASKNPALLSGTV